MPSTTEIPTFFGPSDSPLFGVVHLPTDNRIRGGVLICRSLGKEGIDTVRIERILAEDLALRGFGVLRFDYLGFGDSAYSQVRDDAVSNWKASVGHAVDYLIQIGAATITAVGIRAGCLILDAYLTRSSSVKHAVYLDPVGTGRRYIREHAALHRLSIGEDAQIPGEVSVIGGRFSDRAAAEFSALQMSADPVRADGVDHVLLLGRPGETDKRLTALASAEGVDVVTSSLLQECDKPRDVLLPVPFDAIDSITGWIDKNTSTSTHEVVPRYLTTVIMPAEDNGANVVESIERIEPNGLFAIRTTGIEKNTVPTKTVVFFVTSNDSHVGPNREWVELSRRIATAGSQALRWDPTGLGLSGPVNRGAWRRTYTKSGITESIAVARHACRDASTLQLVGTCSGAWYAAHTALKVGAGSAVLVNLSVWNWRAVSTLLWEWRSRQQAMLANRAARTDNHTDGVDGAGFRSAVTRLKPLLNVARRRTKNFMHQRVPRPFLWMSSQVGLAYVPERILAPLARRGTDATLIVCPEDAEGFLVRGGPAAMDRLRSTSHPPRLLAPPAGDHAAHHSVMVAAVRNVILPVAADSRSDSIPQSSGATND
ncbi:pimeloyl-ACP methyl ester carboxylesterase [Mycobacterium sp. OTB74]|nr:pimeloyl-ACP methyl ester carboxylesterase [Mycobacterium sp. OTB74]